MVHHIAPKAVEHGARARTQHVAPRRGRLGRGVALVGRGGGARRSWRRLSRGSGRNPVARALKIREGR